jgi:hypothetical protein
VATPDGFSSRSSGSSPPSAAARTRSGLSRRRSHGRGFCCVRNHLSSVLAQVRGIRTARRMPGQPRLTNPVPSPNPQNAPAGCGGRPSTRAGAARIAPSIRIGRRSPPQSARAEPPGGLLPWMSMSIWRERYE